jgi:hypothetical protein
VRRAPQVRRAPLGRLVLPELPDHLAPQGQQDQRVIQAPRQNPNSKTLGISVGGPRAGRNQHVSWASTQSPMKHPATSDFETNVTEAGVTVTFKPTNSVYSFYRLADSDDIARLGPVSLQNVRHAGRSGDTEDYFADEVLAMAQRVASEVAASAWSVRPEGPADAT